MLTACQVCNPANMKIQAMLVTMAAVVDQSDCLEPLMLIAEVSLTPLQTHLQFVLSPIAKGVWSGLMAG